jgi:hypothetical protein
MRDWQPLQKVDPQVGNGLAEPWLPAVIQIPMAGNDIIVGAAVVGYIDEHCGLVVGCVLRKNM